MKNDDLMPCFFVSLLLLCLFTGCNKGGLPGLVPASGQVLYDGQPLAESTVTFHAAARNSNLRGAFGTPDSEGEFTLMNLHPKDGIEPREYIVTVSKLKKPPAASEEDVRKFMRGEGPPPPPPSTRMEHEISPKYHSPDTTDLKFVIGPQGDKNIKLELKSK
jgi:hypothetical protein